MQNILAILKLELYHDCTIIFFRVLCLFQKNVRGRVAERKTKQNTYNIGILIVHTCSGGGPTFWEERGVFIF